MVGVERRQVLEQEGDCPNLVTWETEEVDWKWGQSLLSRTASSGVLPLKTFPNFSKQGHHRETECSNACFG